MAPGAGYVVESFNQPLKGLAGIRAYRQVEFTSGSGFSLDTARVCMFVLDDGGQLLESTEYEYRSSDDKDEPWPPPTTD